MQRYCTEGALARAGAQFGSRACLASPSHIDYLLLVDFSPLATSAGCQPSTEPATGSESLATVTRLASLRHRASALCRPVAEEQGSGQLMSARLAQ